MVESFPFFYNVIHWKGFIVCGIYQRGVLVLEGFYSVVKLTRKVHIVRCSGSWLFYCIMCFTDRWSPEGGSLEWRRSLSACPEEFTVRTMSRGQKVIRQAHSLVTVTQGFFKKIYILNLSLHWYCMHDRDKINLCLKWLTVNMLYTGGLLNFCYLVFCLSFFIFYKKCHGAQMISEKI